MVALALVAAVVWTGCTHKPEVRPASIIVACADANFYVDHIRWSSWGAAGAVGKGTAHRNDCTPNCAAGHFHASPVTVRLSKVVTCVKGRREFARISWGAATADSETLPCTFLKLKG
ncbi:MAG: hypothetical protein JOY73_02015 [Actinobacteria bacterium]|nr:hypothetical protein [Actinomycetota bacterium]